MKDNQNWQKTTCSYCGVGCGIKVRLDHTGAIELKGDEMSPVSHGMLCSKGLNLHHVVADISDRILFPAHRADIDSPFIRTNWDTAISDITSKITKIIDQNGPDAFGFYVSGQCLTEEYYIINKLAKGFIGTNNIDTNSRLCMSSAVAGYKKTLGEDAVPVSYDDIELADCFLITGANPAFCHPILFRRIEAHKQKNPEVKIIVIDPRKTQSCELADIHLQINPETDVVLNNALARWLIENDFIDKEFIDSHTNGYDQLYQTVFSLSLLEAAEICGIDYENICATGRMIGESKGFISMWAMGLNQSVVGVDKNVSLINLSLITGRIGKPGNGPFSLTGQPNAMGGREVGGMCNLLPAHRNLDNPEHRKQVADFWKVSQVPEKRGYTASEMFEALDSGKMKAIWIICTNPAVSMPEVRKIEKALRKAELVVVQDISYSSITVDYAHYILPAAGWLEKEGTMTNSDRRISYIKKLMDAPGEALPDIEIIWKFAQKMGYSGFDYAGAADIFNEHCALTAGTNMDISGLSYSRLIKTGSVQWPYPSGAVEGQIRLFEDGKFYTPDKKARLIAVQSQKNEEHTSNEFPLVLTTGRIRDQWHTMTRTGKVNKLNMHIPLPTLEIHPDDAEARNLLHGELVEIFNERGSVRVRSEITETIKKGVVFLPMHWGKVNESDLVRANNLTSPIADPVSFQPNLKYAAVQVKKYTKPTEKIIVIGAGASSTRFLTRMAELRSKDSIEVFSKEKHIFYDRVQLPEYLSGGRSWDSLAKVETGELDQLKLTLHSDKEIVHIDIKNKQVTDVDGKSYNYNKLVLAMGSRPNIPEYARPFKGQVYAMRTRVDADRLKNQNLKGATVLVAGAGLLGLEIAASLIECGAEVSIVNRKSRLMDRQLDNVSAQLLNECVSEAGVNIIFNDEIEELIQKGEGFTVKFLTGKSIYFDKIILALGTKVNTELATKAGVKVQRGVVVNGWLQTSEDSIFAMGEIAEFEGNSWGITAAAEFQAEILADWISGYADTAFKGYISMNILKFPGIKLCALGITEAPDDSYETIVISDLKKRYYKKCIVKNDRLVGAILFGDTAEFSEFKKLILAGTELADKRNQLLRSGSSSEPVRGKLICSCNSVGEENLKDIILTGITELKPLMEKSGAGTGCGSCRPELSVILKKYLVSKSI